MSSETEVDESYFLLRKVQNCKQNVQSVGVVLVEKCLCFYFVLSHLGNCKQEGFYEVLFSKISWDKKEKFVSHLRKIKPKQKF